MAELAEQSRSSLLGWIIYLFVFGNPIVLGFELL